MQHTFQSQRHAWLIIVMLYYHVQNTIQIQELLVPAAQRQCSAEELFDYVVERAIDFAQSIGR